MLGNAILGGVIAFALAVLTTPVGVSGAVFLVPVQVSVLHTPSPAITPTNLLYNVIATPGGPPDAPGAARVLAAPLTMTLPARHLARGDRRLGAPGRGPLRTAGPSTW